MTQLTVTTKIYAALETVRHAYTTPADIMMWNYASDDRYCPSASHDLRVWWVFCSRMQAKDGSRWFDFAGQYILVNLMTHLEYVMWELNDVSFVPSDRTVTVDFVKDGSCGCVTVTTTFDAEKENSHEMQVVWRQAILDNFKSYVESVGNKSQ